jgi:hypothetical protein
MGDGGLTLPAPAGPMTSTPNLDIVKRVVVLVGVNLLKSPLHGLEGRSVRLRRRGICYAIIEICSVAWSASRERLTNEKAAWVYFGVHGLGRWFMEGVVGK